MRRALITGTTLAGLWALPAAAVPGGIVPPSPGATPAAIAAAGGMLANGGTPMVGPLSFAGATGGPLVLPTTTSASGITLNLSDPGTGNATPGPVTAHHGVNAQCIRQGYGNAIVSLTGEMDCINIYARQDGNSTRNTGAWVDTGDLGGILEDIQNTSQTGGFIGNELHTTTLNKVTGKFTHYVVLQDMAGSTNPNDTGQQPYEAHYVNCLEGVCNGLRLIAGADGSQGTTGYGTWGTAFELAGWNTTTNSPSDVMKIDGQGNGYTLGFWHVGDLQAATAEIAGKSTFGDDAAIAAGKSLVFTDNTTKKTQYVNQDTDGYLYPYPLGGDAKGDIKADYLKVLTGGKVFLDSNATSWVEEDSNGLIVIGTGSTRLFSINPANGNVIAKGTITQNGTP